MNSRQRQVQERLLDNEGEVIKQLAGTYGQALEDIKTTISGQYQDIQRLTTELESLPPGDPKRVILESRRRSKVYQKTYQESLKTQLSGVLDQMQARQYTTISSYLRGCYTDGFVGTMYDLHGQGIPLIVPIDQQAVTKAVQLDSKISQGLYNRLGVDVGQLKRRIAAEVSRGMATGQSLAQCAKQIDRQTQIRYNRAIRIARTEGHRIQTTATMDACYSAKERGADVTKQWDATMDDATRESHAAVDGEVRELDKPFSNGLMYPGDPRGPASEVIDCRCALLQRARWALSEAERQSLAGRAQAAGLAQAGDYDAFKTNYLRASGSGKAPVPPSKRAPYAPASTLEAAQQYARNELHLSEVDDYKKLSLDVANLINKEVSGLYALFGDLGTKGALRGIRCVSGPAKYYAAFSPTQKRVYLNANFGGAKALQTMRLVASQQHKLGFWSSGAAEHSFRHELGHAVQHMIIDQNPEKRRKISHLRGQAWRDCGVTTWSLSDTTDHMQAAGRALSYYALQSDGEFIAESVAEYMAGNPRTLARSIVKILLE